MLLDSRQLHDTALIRLREARLDAAIAIAFKEEFRTHLSPDVRRVVLDLSGVSFLDSSGLGALVAVLKLAGTRRAFALAGLTDPVAKVLRLTRMDTVFRIFPTAGSALEELPVAPDRRDA